MPKFYDRVAPGPEMWPLDPRRSYIAPRVQLKFFHASQLTDASYPLNVVIDSSTPARCSALDVAPDSDLGTMYPFVPPAPPRGDRQPLCARERAR